MSARTPTEIAITGNGDGLHLLLGQAHRDASIIKIADAEFCVTELSAHWDGAEYGRVSAKAVELVRCVSAKDKSGPAWNGEGLPPVGTVCEINHVGECDSNGRLWRQVTILAHYSDIRLQSQVAIYMPIDGSASCDQAIAECFRPLRTPEQIAAEERDAACRQMCIDAGGSVCDAQMAKAYMLYDQGYRKQEPV